MTANSATCSLSAIVLTVVYRGSFDDDLAQREPHNTQQLLGVSNEKKKKKKEAGKPCTRFYWRGARGFFSVCVLSTERNRILRIGV